MVTAIAFDYGDARVGTATGNSIARLATPGVVLENGPDLVADAAALVAEQYATIVVVGLPRNMDGSEGPLGPRSRAFATELRERVGGEVQLVDERLSSRAAEESLRIERASGVRTRRLHKGDVDQMAATLILMQWLRRPGTGHG